MSKPYLIIDIGRDRTIAGVFAAKGLKPLAFASRQIENTAKEGIKGAVELLLESLIEKGHREYEKVFLGIPAFDVSLRVIEVPFDDRKKIAEVLPFELSGFLHVDVEETVADAMPLGAGKALAAAVEKEALKGYLEVFKDLGLDPAWVGSSLFSMHLVLKEVFPSNAGQVVLANEFMAAACGGTPAFFKPVRGLDGLRLGMGYLESEGVRIEEAYSFGIASEALRSLAPGAFIYDELTLPEGFPAEAIGVYAVWLQLRKGLLNEAINFRRGEFEYTKDRQEARRALKMSMVIAAVLVLLAGADFSLRYINSAKEISFYKKALRESYLRLFPGEQNISDEAYQLEAKLKSLEKEASVLGGGFSALDSLNAVARGGAGLGVRLFEVSVSEGKLNARGEAGSFEKTDELKARLLKESFFGDVRITDIKASKGGAAFSLTATLR